MKIVITGNSGFIGSYLSSFLLSSGYSLSGIDKVIASGNYHHIQGDILDKKTVESAMIEADCIIHLAAEHKDFGISKEQYYLVNVQGTKNLLDAATEYNVKKFIFFSSVAVYGNNQPSDEHTVPYPINHYGASKLAAENIIQEWGKQNLEREVIIIRPTVIFGPGNKANIYNLIKRVIEGHFYFVGNGNNIKSIAYVENLVAATYFLLFKMKPGVEIFNYSDEPHLTTKQLVKLIAETAHVSVPRLTIPLQAAITSTKVFDIVGKITGRDFPITSARMKKFATATLHHADKIRQLGFQQPYSLQEGLHKNIEWIRRQRFENNSSSGNLSVESL